MKKRGPVVSVLFPIGKNRKYLDIALKSIKSQSFQGIELLAEEDQGEGITKLLIKLARKATGEFLARMDADDISEPDRLEKQVSYLLKHSETQLIGSWAYLIDETEKQIGLKKVPASWSEIKKEVFFHNPLVHSTWMMRRDWYERIGGYNPCYRFSQDWELLLRSVWNSRAENIPEPLLQYRVHQRSTSFALNKTQLYFGLRAQLETLVRGDVPLWKGAYLLPKLGSFLIPSMIKYYLSRR